MTICNHLLIICTFTEPITVGYEFTSYTTSEGQGFVEICAIITEPVSGGAPRPFSLIALTIDLRTAGKYFYERGVASGIKVCNGVGLYPRPLLIL